MRKSFTVVTAFLIAVLFLFSTDAHSQNYTSYSAEIEIGVVSHFGQVSGSSGIDLHVDLGDSFIFSFGNNILVYTETKEPNGIYEVDLTIPSRCRNSTNGQFAESDKCKPNADIKFGYSSRFGISYEVTERLYVGSAVIAISRRENNNISVSPRRENSNESYTPFSIGASIKYLSNSFSVELQRSFASTGVTSLSIGYVLGSNNP